MNFVKRITSVLTCLTFLWSNIYPSIANAQMVLTLSRVPTVNQVMVGPRDIRPSLDNSLENLNGKNHSLSFQDMTDLRKGSAAIKSAVYGYDVANQLLTVDNKITPAGMMLSKHTYTYDTAGNRLTHSNQTTAATKAHSFTYNNIYELIPSPLPGSGGGHFD